MDLLFAAIAAVFGNCYEYLFASYVCVCFHGDHFLSEYKYLCFDEQRNAIKLLDYFGFPESVVEAANRYLT